MNFKTIVIFIKLTKDVQSTKVLPKNDIEHIC